MVKFKKSHAQARRVVSSIPVATKRKCVLTGLLFLTPVCARLDWAVTKGFKDLAAPEDEDQPQMVDAINSYHMVLYLTIELH